MATFDEKTIETLQKNFHRLGDKDQDFAQSVLNAHRNHLTKGWRFTLKQAEWAAKLAARAASDNPHGSAPQHDIGNLSGVADLFARAAQHLKRPAIVINSADTGEIRLSLASGRSRHPGSINVTTTGSFEDRVWFGRIFTDGRYQPSNRISETPQEQAITELLRQFAQHPVIVARAHARLTGKCCFCNRELTDERSTANGYGKQCAERYGMPWEKQASATALAAAAPEALTAGSAA